MSIDLHVAIREKDRKVGAMVKALAFEISGPSSVVGASKQFLEDNGYYIFHFPSEKAATEFREAVAHYLPGLLAHVQ
jgi:hypothetical protein